MRGLFLLRSLICTLNAVTCGLALSVPGAKAEDISLDAAWNAALTHNVDVAILTEQTLQAKNQRIKAWSLVSPQLTASGSWTLNQYEAVLDMGDAFSEFEDFLPAGTELDFGDPIVVQPKSYLQGSLSVVQPLLNGAAFPLLMGSYRNASAVQLDQTHQTQRIKAGVARAFFSLATAREAETLASQALETAGHHEALATKQVDAGLVPPRTRLSAQLRTSQAQRDVLAAAQQVAQAEEAFHQLTGLNRQVQLTWPDTSLSVPQTLEAAFEQATHHRADLQAADLRVRIAQLQRTSLRLGWLPTVQATFSGVYTQNTGFIGENTFWTAGVQANFPLWDGGMRLAQIREAASQHRVASLSAQRQRQKSREEVRLAWESLKHADSAIQAMAREQTLARENYALTQAGFSAGTATWLEVQEAELAARSAALNGLRAQMNLELARIQLLVATGAY